MQWRTTPDAWPGRQVLSAAQMREADRHTIEVVGVPARSLMEVAGAAVATAVFARIGPADRICVMCGSGNNGGDGHVAARRLNAWGANVQVVHVGQLSRMSPAAKSCFEATAASGLTIHPVDDLQDFVELPAPGHYTVIVDALLGIGLSGPLRAVQHEAVAWMNGHGAALIAVDIPSGLCADTGRALGAATWAEQTVTFGFSQPGHWLYPGPDHCGALLIADIGIDAAGASSSCRLLDAGDLVPALAPLQPNTHKGQQGRVVVVGGMPGRVGAVKLCGRAALAVGAGLVSLATDGAAFEQLSTGLVEMMAEVALTAESSVAEAAQVLASRLNTASAVVLGPGMVPSSRWAEFLLELLPRLTVPTVLDADALNHLAGRLETVQICAPLVLTPHPGEAGRLLNCDAAFIQNDRFAAVAGLVSATGGVVALKGAHTLVGTPDGAVGICTDGHAAMATAGTGDVLAGMIGGLLAQGLTPGDATRAAVVWHARAGVRAAALKGRGMLASDLLTALSEVEMNRC